MPEPHQFTRKRSEDVIQLFTAYRHERQGDGYGIHIEHTLSNHSDGLIDLVLVTLHQD